MGVKNLDTVELPFIFFFLAKGLGLACTSSSMCAVLTAQCSHAGWMRLL